MKEETKKKILLIVICIATISVLVLAVRLCDNKTNSTLSISVINDSIKEIHEDEINTILVEHPNSIIYISNSSDESSIKFEKRFKKVIKKYNLENDIIYLNINNITVVNPLYQNAPVLLFYDNKEVHDMIDCTRFKSNKDIIAAFKERGVIND